MPYRGSVAITVVSAVGLVRDGLPVHWSAALPWRPTLPRNCSVVGVVRAVDGGRISARVGVVSRSA